VVEAGQDVIAVALGDPNDVVYEVASCCPQASARSLPLKLLEQCVQALTCLLGAIRTIFALWIG